MEVRFLPPEPSRLDAPRRGELPFLYYAHLSTYGALGRVAADAVVGHVGATGDARGLIPHLDFELHPGGGKAVDAFADSRPCFD